MHHNETIKIKFIIMINKDESMTNSTVWQSKWKAIVEPRIPMFPTKFQVNWPFGSGELKKKNRFSRWPPWISDRNDFSYFWSTCRPDASCQVSSRLASRFRRRSSCGHGTKAVIQNHKSINEWRIRMFRPTDMDPRTKGVIRRPRKGEAKNKFSKWPP